jgi:hypothetical protein
MKGINWGKVSLINWLSAQIDEETTIISNADSAENEYEYAYALGARDALTATLAHILRED